VLAVRGSTGSVQPLIEIVRDLLDDLPTSVLLTIHVGEQTRLPQILPRSDRYGRRSRRTASAGTGPDLHCATRSASDRTQRPRLAELWSSRQSAPAGG
jgi:hypothetical protein